MNKLINRQRECANCGKPFYKHINLARSKYCSERCSHIVAYKRAKIKRQEALVSGKIHGVTWAEYIFNRYRNTAKKKKREFTLTVEDFNNHWQANCYYCDDKLSMVGFDRIDSSKGYIQENIVPCCTLCNLMKRHISSVEFVMKCKKIAINATSKELERLKDVELNSLSVLL